MSNNYTQKIIDTLRPIDAALKYLGEPSNKFSRNSSWYCCPFHLEKTPSMQVYHDYGKGFYCRGCSTGGSVVLFVQKLFQINNLAACKLLDSDFNLGIFENYTPETYKAKQQRENAIKLAAKKAQDEEKQFNELCVELRDCERKIRDNAPQKPITQQYLDSNNTDKFIAATARQQQLQRLIHRIMYGEEDLMFRIIQGKL